MSGINKVVIVGRLGKDPEVRYTQNGNAVANLSVATSKKYKGEEETEWHRIVCFSKVAEVAEKYLRKGDLAGFEGELRTRKWQDQGGNDRYSTEIIVHNLHLLGSSSDRPAQQPADHVREKPQERQQDLDDGFDDIPF